MMGPSRLSSVPKMMLPVYDKIVGLTDDVCDRHLNYEYRDSARAMTGAFAESARVQLLPDNRERGRAPSSMFLGG
jgi:hypothetical protein